MNEVLHPNTARNTMLDLPKNPNQNRAPDIGSSSREQLQILTKLRDDIMRIADMSAAIDMVQGSRKKLMETDCLQQSYSLELPH